MFPKIDWYEFIIHNPAIEPSVGQGDLSQILVALSQLPNCDVLVNPIGDFWETHAGKGVWGQHWQHRETGVSVFLSRDYDSYKVALSGSACDKLNQFGQLNPVISSTRTTCCRVDLAVDFPFHSDNVAGAACVKSGKETQAKETRRAKSQIITPSGSTFYLGSWSSERYCRLYHYNAPHPRSRLVRVEAVYKGQWAKKLLEKFDDRPVADFVKTALEPYKWKGFDTSSLGDTVPDVRLPRSDKDGGARMRWLLTVCIPALRKAIEDGDLNIHNVLYDLGQDVNP